MIWNLDQKQPCNIIEDTGDYISVDQLIAVIEDLEVAKKVQEIERKIGQQMDTYSYKEFLKTDILEIANRLDTEIQTLNIVDNKIDVPLGIGYENFYR